MIDLSVLICSTHTRWQTFGRSIQAQVWGQVERMHELDQKRVEILMLTDNKQMMLGHKRNVMVDMAQGRYVVFVDDDDRLEPNYLGRLLSATAFGTDVITFLVSVSLNGADPRICRYSKDFRADRNTSDGYERLPNHICATKRELASRVSYPNQLYGEDVGYSKLLKPLLKTEHHIPEVLYHYDYNVNTTEAQEHIRARLRRRKQAPIVDIVMLSKAATPELAEMTQQAIDTCIAGANSLPVNVIVLEQTQVIYRRAQTVYMPEEFHYNRFANLGAGLGSAEWLMIANSDLTFHDGWLHHLLAADHPVVSPKSPGDQRQAAITENTVGAVTGQHFSGWCFMLKRKLWEKIDGFDEDFAFWCADDAVIEQLKAIGVTPMLVPAAQVEHKVAATHQAGNITDDLTWGQVDLFMAKYGHHRLARHHKFRRWKAEQQ